MTVTGNSPRKQQRPVDEDIDGPDYASKSDEEEDTVLPDIYTASDKSLPGSRDDVSPNTVVLPSDNQSDVILRAEEYLQTFLIDMTGKSSSKIFDLLKSDSSLLRLKKSSTLLEKGQKNGDLFVIVDGSVDVLLSDGDVIREMRAGEILGDISAIFKIPVTATVRVKETATLLRIISTAVQTLFKNTKLSMTDWAVGRNFLPTCEALDPGRVYRRMTFNALKKTSLFHELPEAMVKQLILK